MNFSVFSKKKILKSSDFVHSQLFCAARFALRAADCVEEHTEVMDFFRSQCSSLSRKNLAGNVLDKVRASKNKPVYK